jgi:DNA polymerase-3 subunit delta'
MPRYFPAASIAPGADLVALNGWMAELKRVARHAEHPWNASLVVESLVQQGQRALAAPVKSAAGKRAVSVHSRA